jgi:hypothetical protein
VCIYACKTKVELRPPCRECLAQWAEDMHRLYLESQRRRNPSELGIEHAAIVLATDREYQEWLERECPVVDPSEPAMVRINDQLSIKV